MGSEGCDWPLEPLLWQDIARSLHAAEVSEAKLILGTALIEKNEVRALVPGLLVVSFAIDRRSRT